MPLVHRNSLNFIGMDRKKEYFIWLETDGEFTAMNKDTGKLQSWSTVSGKMITKNHWQKTET